MISLSHFTNKSSKSAQRVDRSIGMDGYPAYARKTICEFQAIVEREQDADFEALAMALKKARDPQFVITLVNLRAAYNDSCYATAQYAYVSR